MSFLEHIVRGSWKKWIKLEENCFRTNLLDLPDEILEDYLLPYVSFDDLLNLMNVGNKRLKTCSKKLLKRNRLVSTYDYNIIF